MAFCVQVAVIVFHEKVEIGACYNILILVGEGHEDCGLL